MEQMATGTFEVTMKPVASAGEGVTLGRLTLNKRFAGDLQGVSHGEMLATRTPVANSAGYVAMELVTGTLQGKTGTFVLQHSGTMNRGEATLEVHVVPDSGTAELQGIAGKLAIKIENGRHFYTFDYTLPES